MMMSAQSCCSICTLTDWDGKDLLIGGKGDDTFIGGGGDDLMFGGAGDDTFQGYDDSNPAPENGQDATGYQGNDWIDGGSGNDTMGYSSNSGDQAATNPTRVGLLPSPYWPGYVINTFGYDIRKGQRLTG